MRYQHAINRVERGVLDYHGKENNVRAVAEETGGETSRALPVLRRGIREGAAIPEVLLHGASTEILVCVAPEGAP